MESNASVLPREMGGYLEVEEHHGSCYHDDALPLNLARNCLAYLIKARSIKSIWLPDYICDSVISACQELNVSIRYYEIGFDYLPRDTSLVRQDDWLYIVNYFGQLRPQNLENLREVTNKLILDNTQAFFETPPQNTDTIYTCRKFFGVADGAFLYTAATLDEDLPQTRSYDHQAHILGRFESSASDFYPSYRESEAHLASQPVGKMSRLTLNTLRGLDFARIARTRQANYRVLAERLSSYNFMSLHDPHVPFMYPLYLEDGARIRTELHRARAYIPTLWPNVLNTAGAESAAFQLASKTIPLPVDQRYAPDEMHLLADLVEELIGS